MAWYRVNMNFKNGNDAKIEQKMPKISIFTSVFNGAKYLDIATNSALAQNIPDWAHQQRFPGDNKDTLPPILIVDQNRTVHVFFPNG